MSHGIRLTEQKYWFLQDVGVPVVHNLGRMVGSYYEKYGTPPQLVVVNRSVLEDVVHTLQQAQLPIEVSYKGIVVPPFGCAMLEPDMQDSSCTWLPAFKKFLASAETTCKQGRKVPTSQTTRSSPMADMLEHAAALAIVDVPTETATAPRRSAKAVQPAQKTVAPKRATTPVETPASTRVSFALVVAKQLVAVGSQVFYHKDRKRAALVLPNGNLRCSDGFEGSIHAVGAHLAGTKSTNGWITWFVLQGQEWKVIDTMRKQLSG